MRKVSILLVVALIATSCAVGTYHPYAQNNFGAQSTVVLDKANFRVVRDVEAIVDVNNTNLSRADVASSAYGELLRKAQLTGSQVLINVVIEEVRRETAGFFRLLFGMPKRVQHVAARATIIEFLDENGNPRVSESYRPTNTHTTVTAQPIKNSNTNVSVQEVETIKTQPIQKAPTEAELKAIQIKEDIQKIKQTHKSIIKLTSSFPYSTAYDIYEKLYKKLLNTEENLQTIRKIQPVVILYLNSRGTAFPQIEQQLKNSSSIEEQINIFLSYSQEQ
jgi:PBP1b-binding outer membrane lipoprotein LpoB